MQKTTSAFYQPNYAYTITIWSWIGFVYTLALIVQLELINLNWQSWLIGIIAVFLTIWAIIGHQIQVTDTTITLKRPVFKYNRTITREVITAITVQKHGLLIQTNELDYQPEQILLRGQSKQALVDQLKQTGWPIKTA